MRKPVAILITSLILVTALVLGALARAFYVDSSRPAAATAARPQAAMRFYDALNAALASGDTQGLRGLLAPDFVDHDADGPFAPDGNGLAARVLALRSTFPGMTLVPEAVSNAGELSVWRVTVTGAADGALLDLPVRAASAWNALDIFQSRDGKILAHWGSGSRALLGPAPQRIEFALAKSGRWVPAMERWDFPPGSAEESAAGETPKVVLVRAGTVRVGNGSGPEAAVPLATISGRGELSPLRAGDWRDLVINDVLLLPPGAAVSLQNLSDGPAAVLFYGLTQPAIWGTAMGLGDSATPESGAPPVVKTTVASAPPQVLGAGAYQMELGRVVVPPGGGAPAHETQRLSLLLVEHGTITISASADGLFAYTAATGTYRLRESANLGDSDAAVVTAGAEESLFNAGADAAALVVVNLAAMGG